MVIGTNLELMYEGSDQATLPDCRRSRPVGQAATARNGAVFRDRRDSCAPTARGFERHVSRCLLEGKLPCWLKAIFRPKRFGGEVEPFATKPADSGRSAVPMAVDDRARRGIRAGHSQEGRFSRLPVDRQDRRVTRTGRPELSHGVAVIALVAVVLAAVDQVSKRILASDPALVHHRSTTWMFLSGVCLVGALLAARVRDGRLSAAAGVFAGGVLGNLISARWENGNIPNPLLLGSESTGIAMNLADVFILLGLVLVGGVLISARRNTSATCSVRPRRRSI